MPSALGRRLTALENRRATTFRTKEFKVFIIRGLDAAAEARWRAENVEAPLAAGCPVLVVSINV